MLHRVKDLCISTNPKPQVAFIGTMVSNRYELAATGPARLLLSEFPAFTSNTVVDDIVVLKAQYGLAASSTSTTVSSWVSGATVINNTNADRVIAVRVGVIARSPLYEKNAIDAATTLSVLPAINTGGAVSTPGPGLCAGSSVTGEVKCSAPSGGDHYRYRAYSTIVPLRNAIWTRQ
jgi:hypothetical protein